MGTFDTFIKRFRRLPTPLLVLLVLSRFVFGLGLGAAMAGSMRCDWKRASGLIMLLAVLLALPGAVKVLTEE